MKIVFDCLNQTTEQQFYYLLHFYFSQWFAQNKFLLSLILFQSQIVLQLCYRLIILSVKTFSPEFIFTK